MSTNCASVTVAPVEVNSAANDFLRGLGQFVEQIARNHAEVATPATAAGAKQKRVVSLINALPFCFAVHINGDNLRR